MSDLGPFLDPFADYAFMRRALAACVALSLGSAPLGVFMMLRRMTLVGDALAHAILPGVALGFLVAGLSVWAMTFGGFAAALFIGLAATFLTRMTQLKEDGAFTLLYLLCLSIGVILVSLKGGQINLLHLLFGNILAIDREALLLVTGVSILSLYGVAAFFRRFVIDGFDPDFLGASGGRFGGFARHLFFALLMLNLVAAFQAMATLMALGLMLLPALAARFWTRSMDWLVGLSVLLALGGSYGGLLLSFYAGLPSGPAIVLVLGCLGLGGAVFGGEGSVRAYLREGRG
jgi:zinc/manganese transport system permease protein